jgi:hypothetical protein
MLIARPLFKNAKEMQPIRFVSASACAPAADHSSRARQFGQYQSESYRDPNPNQVLARHARITSELAEVQARKL